MDLLSDLVILLSLLPLSRSTCDRDLLALAFRSVAGFHPPPPLSQDCRHIHELKLSSHNLSGTVSWTLLRNITTLRVLDLSSNALCGSIPSTFWSFPALARVNLAGNRLGGALRFPPAAGGGGGTMRSLNLSGNRFTSAIGLSHFRNLRILDLSNNSISGDLPPLAGLAFVNFSYNNFTGIVDEREIARFGSSAFIKAGSLVFVSPSSSPRASRLRLKVAVPVASAVALAAFLTWVLCIRRRKEMKPKKGWATEAPEAPWVSSVPPSAPVVVFEKPLMELTFSDIAAATSGFGRESQLAEGGQSGAAYRAVLPGDMHVVVRVAEGAAREMEEGAFRALARLRHPNLLPLLGFCVAGRERLLLHEYMERGDLHRWLHELPPGRTDVEHWSEDVAAAPPASADWPTRHRIAVGVARGVAFLHQGWVGVVHGHVAASNVLLGEDMEPRVADFGIGAAGAAATVEEDVWGFGKVVVELVTGREGEGVVEWARGMVREGRGLEAADRRMVVASPEEEREVVECLRVGYLCTAPAADKRPTMQQVVALLKDIRPMTSSSAAASSTSCV